MLGKENLFIFDDRKPQLHMQKALQRAKILADVQLSEKITLEPSPSSSSQEEPIPQTS